MLATLADLEALLPSLARLYRLKTRQRAYRLSTEDLIQSGRLGLWAYAVSVKPDAKWDSDLFLEDPALASAKREMGRLSRSSRLPKGLRCEEGTDPRDYGKTARQILQNWPCYKLLARAEGWGHQTKQGWPRLFRIHFRRNGEVEEIEAWKRSLYAQAEKILRRKGIRPVRDPASEEAEPSAPPTASQKATP